MADVGVSTPITLMTTGPAEPVGYRIAKRLLDIAIVSVVLILTIPVILAVVVAIRIDSPGPAIFSQQRMRGRRTPGGARDEHGAWSIEPFTLFKFRTMRAHADHSFHMAYMEAYLSGDEQRLLALRPDRKEGESYRPATDPRVTRVGAALRKLSLDELPQLWNVLRGDMTLVGPRPPMPYEVERYSTSHLRRLASRPGLTGLAQVRGRAAIGFEDVVAYDLEYINHRSVWFDLKILLLTVPTVLTGKGAD